MKKLTIILGSIFILFSTSLQAQVFQEWVRTYSGSDSINDISMALDVNGGIYITGQSTSSTSHADITTIKYNKAGVQQWVAAFNGTGNGYDLAVDIVLDKNDNAYITGRTFGGATGNDYITIKYNAAGTQLWAALYNGPANSNDQASAITLDKQGNVYITGKSTSSTSLDYATIKYNANGVQQWVTRYNGPANIKDEATAIGVDKQGNVYVTGQSIGTAHYDYATIKYNPNGVQLWVARYNGPGNSADQALDLILDNKANIYITGRSPGIGTGTDFATIKYNTAGAIQWIQRYNGSGNGGDVANSIALDAAGNVFVSGGSDGGASSTDYATVKYDNNGNFQWVARFDGGANSKDQSNDIETDKDGNVYVTGVASTSPVNIDYATIKYDKDGVEQWRQIFDGVNHGTTFQDWDWANALSIDDHGNVYVTGYSWNGSNFDFATVKYREFEISKGSDKMIIPDGSTITENIDGSFSITPPDGFIYVGFDVNQQVMVTDGTVKVDCRCIGSGWCLPFFGKGPLGDTQCCTGECTNCKKTVIKSATNETYLKGAGFINPNAGISFVKKDVKQLPAAFEAMYYVPEVQNALTSFIDQIYKGDTVPNFIEKNIGGEIYLKAPKGFTIAPINIFGRATTLPVPRQVMNVGAGGGEVQQVIQQVVTVMLQTILIVN